MNDWGIYLRLRSVSCLPNEFKQRSLRRRLTASIFRFQPCGSIVPYVCQAFLDLKSSPLSRCIALLFRSRELMSSSTGAFFRAPRRQCVGRLLPAHLPPSPPELFGGLGVVVRSRRIVKRLRVRQAAWILSELQWCAFGISEASSPKEPSEYLAHLGHIPLVFFSVLI